MARRRSKSWYISRLVRATGIVKDEVVNVTGGSADSDVAAIAELRRDADSEELQIQSIRTAIDSDYALFNAKIAAFNGLTDSDLTTVAKLRNDVDSDSLKIQALETTVNNLPTPSGGVSLTEVTDSDGREAISSPKEGDIAILYGLGPGTNTGITNNYSNGNVMTYVGGSGSTYNNGQQTFTSSVFAPHAQVGDVIVVENSTVTGSNGYSQTGTLITAVCELIDNTTFKVMHTFGWSWNSQPGGTGGHPASGLVNRALKNYFDNAANPRGDIPSAAVAAGAGGGNAHAASFAWTGGVATLYRMFDTVESVFQANPSSGFTNGAPHAYNDNVNGTVVAAGYSKPEVWLYQDSDDLTPAGWKSHFKSFDSDQVVAIINENVVSGSVDSDVAAIAALRRDADSDSIRIQEIATSLEQINGLVDSDLKAIADLRNDLDSESIRISSLASSGGVTVTEVTDSDGREAISSPSEGDIAVQWGSSAGINTGVTYDFGGSALFSFDVPYQPSDYSSAEATLTNATFAAAAQVGDVIAVQNSTIRYYVHPNYYTDQGTSTGTLMMVVVQVVNSTTLKVAFRNTFNFPAQSSSGYVNTDMYNYFGNPANPRGDIPSGALIAGGTVGNTFNYWSSKQWIGGLATLYRMFDANTKSAYGENPTGTPHAYNDDYTGTATPLPNSNPNVYIRNDSVWQTYIDQQITTTVDSDYVHARIDSEYINSLGFIYNTDITEVTDSDQRVAINNPKEGDIAVQFRAGTGHKTNISYDFGGANLWSKTVYLANGTLGLTYVTASDVGNGRFKWSHATFDDHVQKGDVIVVENATLTTSPGVNPWASRTGTFLFTCHTPKIGGTAPWYNIAAYAYVQSQGSTAWLNSDISGYFGDTSANVNTTNPRGSIPAAAQMVHSYGNINNSSATTSLSGGVATLYRMFDANTYLDAYETSGGSSSVAADHTGNAVGQGYLKPLIYHHDGNIFRSYIEDHILGTIDSDYVANIVNDNTSSSSSFDSDQIVAIINENPISSSVDSDVAAIAALRRDADSDSIRIQEIATSLEQINSLVDSDLKAIADLRNDVDSDSIVLQSLSSMGVTITEVGDSDNRATPLTDGISNPREGDLAVSFSSTPGALKAQTTISSGTAVLSYTVATSSFGQLRQTLTDATIAAVAKKGDLIVINGTHQLFYSGNWNTATTGHQQYGSNPGNLAVVVAADPTGNDIPVFHVTGIQSGSYFVRDLNVAYDNLLAAGVVGDIPVGTRAIREVESSIGHSHRMITSGSSNNVSVYSYLDGSTLVDVWDQNGGTYPGSIAGINTTTVMTVAAAAGQKFWVYRETGTEWIALQANTPFDSDQIVAIINENTSASSIDSDVAAVAQLRRDADSDSIAIQSLRTSIDSDYALFNAKFALLNGLTDSDLTTVSNLRNDLDSESAEIRLLRRELDSDIANIPESTTNVTQRVYSFSSSQPTTTFSGNDDNGQTLSYSVGRIQVYLNGLLLTEGALKDYTATNGTSVVLTEATDSEDILTVAKFLGTPDDVITKKYIYKVSPAGNHTPFDSEFTGVDENGTTLSYTPGKIQVFLNGILLQDSDDYIANNGSTITLLAAPDSDDVLVVYRYLGTQVAGFDSDQVVSIINENASTLPWVEKTSSVAVTAGQKIIVDTSSAVTVTLPASASLGDEIRIIDGTGTAATNNITVARNGHNIMGTASDLTINLNASGIGLVYYNASRGWILIEN